MRHFQTVKPAGFPDEPGPERLVPDFGRIARNQWRVIVAVVALIMGASALFVLLAPARFAATASILVEPRRSTLQTQSQAATDAASESANIETQAEILRSEAIAAAVVRKLQLADDPEFSKPGRHFFDWFKGWLQANGDARSADESKRFKATVDLLKQRLSVRRAALTSLIEITAVSSSPEKAAKIANSAANIFIEFQLDASSAAAQDAAKWLNDRLLELREQSEAAEAAVANFKMQGGVQQAATLRELASRAQAYRSLYDAFLARVAASKTDLYPIPETRLVSAAAPPLQPSFPKPGILLPLALLASLMLSGAIAWAREQFGQKVRSKQDVLRLVATECLGPVKVPDLDAPLLIAPAPLPFDPGFPSADPFRASLNDLSLLLQVAQGGSDCMVVGVTSVAERVGKTSVAAHLASTIASSGCDVLLIDGNFHRPSLSRMLEANQDGLAPGGLHARVVVQLAEAGDQTSHAESFLRIHRLVQQARKTFHYVIIDLPPFSERVDVKSCASLIDGFVLVLATHKDTTRGISEGLDAVPCVRARLVASFVNDTA